MNVFQRFYARLKRNNKKMLISSSGSVPGQKWEKIRSEQFDKYGIGYSASEEIPFLTPKDNIVKRK